MKYNLLLALSFALLISSVSAQDVKKTIPSATVKSLDGKSFNTSDFNNDGKPMIINFWATWCAPCKKELNNIAEVYEDWVDETGVKLIAISIDDARSQTRVLPYINGSSWDYEVYIDENQDFKRSMGVNNVPHTFLVDGSGNIVYQHNNYAPGDEDELFEKIIDLLN
ncbi:MAG: cytochrome c biogenesis protein CcmG/thiol:disulfide interchange protein DsbE [Granulosicoccus sp.]|jgi:cytochrome c biogenesis protein CcmG/thiol:disulfide interchange protein DsbE